MISRRRLLATALSAPIAAHAQVLSGNRPMRWVVPFPPGGQGDAIARAWADAYTSATRQAIVIDNRGGANGLLGIAAVKEAPADGTVLGVFNISFFTALPLMMAKAPYDPVRDLTPIARLVTSTVLCCVTAERAKQRGWNNFRALIEWAKRPGQKLSKGSAGNGGPAHLLIATIAKRSGADILHVPYRGGAPALADLLGGQIDMVFDFMPALLPQIASGRLVPLAVGSRERSPLLPDVPGLGEFADLGIGDLDLPGRVLRDEVDVPVELAQAHPGITDVMEVIRAVDMSSNAPGIFIARANHALGAKLQLVEVAHFPGQVMQPG